MALTLITLNPHPDIIDLNNDFRLALIDELDNHKQLHTLMSEPTDKMHCCLCVATRMEGATHADYYSEDRDIALPSDIDGGKKRFPHSYQLSTIRGAILVDHPHQTGQEIQFWQINDEFLNFKQLQQLLRGNAVQTKVNING